MDERGLTPIEGVESQEIDDAIEKNAEPADPNPEPQEPQEELTDPPEQPNTNPSPEPESGIGKEVDSGIDPNEDLDKCDDIDELEKPKADIIMDQQPSPNTSGDEGEAETKKAAEKPKTTSKPPRFDNSVEPIEYDVPMPRAPRGGGFGGNMGRGPRKAVVIIVVVSVIAVALVVGLVLAADTPGPKPTATLYGYMETNNIKFRPEFNKSTIAHFTLVQDFLASMESLFFKTTFESAYNNTQIVEFGKNTNDYLTIDFMMGLRYFFDNTTDDQQTTGNISSLPVTMTTNSMETTMELPAIDGNPPLWVANIIYFVYEKTALGKLGNLTGTISLSTTNPDDKTTKHPSTIMMTTKGGTQ